MRSIVVIVAKEPVPAQVKTRLSTHLSAGQSAELYSLFIQDMVEEMSKIPGASKTVQCDSSSHTALALAYTPEKAKPIFEKILPIRIPLFPQQGADLGERLANIFNRLFTKGYDQVHIINSDSPDMFHCLVKGSISLLEQPQTELVLGPCSDGGYYLIGLKRPIPELFEQMPWSTDRVLDKTLEKARFLGLPFALLEPWYDIDTHDDLLKFLARHKNRGDGDDGPGWRTLRYLRTLIIKESTSFTQKRDNNNSPEKSCDFSA